MTRRSCRAPLRIGMSVLICCLGTTPLLAQSGTPSAQDIWRHLPPLPGRQAAPEPEPAPEPAPEPTPGPTVAPAPVAAPAPAAPAPVRRTPEPARTPAPTPASPTIAGVPQSGVPAPGLSERAAPGTSRTLAEARVVIHYPEQGGYARSQELVRLLRAIGTGEVETRPVQYAVDLQSIRYFFAADREVTYYISDLVGGGGPATVADFTYFRPSPRVGTIEIWLPTF